MLFDLEFSGYCFYKEPSIYSNLLQCTFNNGYFFIQKALCWFPSFPSFHFLSQSIFENSETTENFHKLIPWGIKGIYLISSTFLSIVCDQDTTRKVLLKVINDNLPWKLENIFFVVNAKMVLKWKIDCFWAVLQ